MKIKINGLEFYEGHSGTRPFHILAHGVVMIDDIAIYGVALAWSAEQGATALAPIARLATGAQAVRWDSRSAIAKEIADKMLELYLKIGGELPEPPAPRPASRQYIPYDEIDYHDTPAHLPLKERIRLALEHESEIRGVECYTSIIEPLDDDDDDEDDTAGLQRTLGCPIVETMEAAGL